MAHGRNPKRSFEGNQLSKKQKKQKLEAPLQITGSHDEILAAELEILYTRNSSPETPSAPLAEPFTEVDVEILELSSTGDGLGRVDGQDRIFVVPFAVPGDLVTAKVIRHMNEPAHTITDFVRVVKPGPERDDSLIKCKYFAKCSGCQLQMLPYDVQLSYKRRVVEDAYKHFARLPAEAIPRIGNTIGSPLEYGYRTKLTPHFDGPPGSNGRKHKPNARFEKMPPIGFMLKGTRRTLDIEECPIGTSVVNAGMKRERQRVERQLDQYKRGATILLRESTQRLPTTETQRIVEAKGEGTVETEEHSDHVLVKRCVSDHKGTSTEYVGNFVFQNPANAFFQNNNSILPRFIAYVRDRILPRADSQGSQITNLIDAYSGSGLFGINLSSLFSRTIGIDISGESIDSAMENLKLNNLHDAKRDIKFIAGDASKLFASVPDDWRADETAVLIDPPRKGCDESFMRQLIAFRPARIVYVSCNVHTQARDVGWILRAGQSPDEERDTVENLAGAYEMESLCGFDFFPQTGHVEGVAVLRRKTSACHPEKNERDDDQDQSQPAPVSS